MSNKLNITVEELTEFIMACSYEPMNADEARTTARRMLAAEDLVEKLRCIRDCTCERATRATAEEALALADGEGEATQ